jgi:redox-sensitive bicupin YhaK (pirin superfamily)
MLWAESIPVVTSTDEGGKTTKVTVIAGQVAETRAPEPAPDSWAADRTNEVAIWIVEMEEGARWELPAASEGLNRRFYVYEGEGVLVDGSRLDHYHAAELKSDAAVIVENGKGQARLLCLQGRPIGEAVLQYGPFVMNTRTEIQEAFEDYQKTQFGGWPWDRSDPVHGRERSRFARYADGRMETP